VRSFAVVDNDEFVEAGLLLKEMVQPRLVAQIEFLEWTGADHLRHSKFAGLREDKDPKSVVKELFSKYIVTARRPPRVLGISSLSSVQEAVIGQQCSHGDKCQNQKGNPEH
jgi:hypothetical protein